MEEVAATIPCPKKKYNERKHINKVEIRNRPL